MKTEDAANEIYKELVHLITETNGISLSDTLELFHGTETSAESPYTHKLVYEFQKLLSGFGQSEVDIQTLFNHPVSDALFLFLKNFPIPYREEHIHLTGSLTADFIYPRLKKLLQGPNKALYEKKIRDVYGKDALPIKSAADVEKLIVLKDGDLFDAYLRILLIPKLILTSRKAHEEAAFHMASELYHKYNVGSVRLKFTLNRASAVESEQIPGLENLTEEDVVLGLYDGFMRFRKTFPDFQFILSPSFRKEAKFFDTLNYKTKADHFDAQVETILELIRKHPKLFSHLCEVDTVGNERELFRKAHFLEMKKGFRKLQYYGFRIRSHHGETWRTLRKGVQAVDNAMNIWHIDTLEHGLSLGINPNFYYHRIYQRILNLNQSKKPLTPEMPEYNEIYELEWGDNTKIRDKLIAGKKLTLLEIDKFTKAKFHTAREVEHYQHDVLNRMLDKGVSLVSLPSSNLKLTGQVPDFKDHPFSWWEKKGVRLGVGTDNYVTLATNYLRELLIILYSDPDSLKITKLLMVATGEGRRPYISHLMWEMRKKIEAEN